jgi:hypothetical protein
MPAPDRFGPSAMVHRKAYIDETNANAQFFRSYDTPGNVFAFYGPCDWDLRNAVRNGNCPSAPPAHFWSISHSDYLGLVQPVVNSLSEVAANVEGRNFTY